MARASSARQVFLFVPNLIGYVRIVLAVASLRYMLDAPQLAIALYLTSGLLDAIDGFAARLLDQNSRFGAVLDMVTDRCATACLLVGLAVLYPRWAFLFQLLVALDVGSHWMHMSVVTLARAAPTILRSSRGLLRRYASLVQGATSHKSVAKGPLLRLYYTSRPVLFIMCAANELAFASLYLLYFWEGKHRHARRASLLHATLIAIAIAQVRLSAS